MNCLKEAIPPIASRSNCEFKKLPILYLGLQIGANPRFKDLWKPVVEKFEKIVHVKNAIFICHQSDKCTSVLYVIIQDADVGGGKIG